MQKALDYGTQYLKPCGEKAVAIGLVILAIFCGILLALTLGDRDC